MARLDFCIYYVCPHVVFVYVLCCVFVEVVRVSVFLSSLVDCVFPPPGRNERGEGKVGPRCLATLLAMVTAWTWRPPGEQRCPIFKFAWCVVYIKWKFTHKNENEKVTLDHYVPGGLVLASQLQDKQDFSGAGEDFGH